jgi:hypothetical protein
LKLPLASYRRLAFALIAVGRELNPKLELKTSTLELQSFGPQCSMQCNLNPKACKKVQVPTHFVKI